MSQKPETEFDIARAKCEICNQWRFFYRLKTSSGSWFCQICSSEVDSAIQDKATIT